MGDPSGNARHVGINVPLFSLRSSGGWGIGELTDLEPFVAWLGASGCDRLMLLPLGAMKAGETSPYSALSTLAIDPIYVHMPAVPDFVRAGGIPAMSDKGQRALEQARQSRVVAYEQVRTAKAEALALAFSAFLRDEWQPGTERSRALANYIADQAWWLDDYALYQSLSTERHSRVWTEWEGPLRDRDPEALAGARARLARNVLAEQYAQWLAEDQWRQARAVAQAHGVAIFGDLPFVAGTDSPEIWAQAKDFRLDVSTGVPPDAFSPTGQDWGLPTYRWDAIRAGGYTWLRARARRMATLFDGLRVDHTIGLYRTYGRPANGEPFFTPADEPTQIRQGQEILTILAETGLDLIAEDLGVIPDFLRQSLHELGIPGCKVLRWERDWHADGTPFIEPAALPVVSAAMTGTHDTEPLSHWWRDLPLADRSALLDLHAFRDSGLTANQPWSDALRDRLIEMAYQAGSRDLFLPLQDVFGWEDRINLPGTVGPHNWTWALPWPVDRIEEQIEARRQADRLRALSAATGRGRLH